MSLVTMNSLGTHTSLALPCLDYWWVTCVLLQVTLVLKKVCVMVTINPKLLGLSDALQNILRSHMLWGLTVYSHTHAINSFKKHPEHTTTTTTHMYGNDEIKLMFGMNVFIICDTRTWWPIWVQLPLLNAPRLVYNEIWNNDAKYKWKSS